jgi:hypothetical protein
MCCHHHIRVEALIIVSFVEGFCSGGGAAIVPAAVMVTTHPSRLV